MIENRRPFARPSDWFWPVIVTLAIAGLFFRFYQLSDRPIAHDESLFAYYSYSVYPNKNYRYDPILHGPLLEHLTAALFATVGASDWTARFWPAFIGACAILLVGAFRSRIGTAGGIAAAALFCISPTLVHYSRFMRNDMILLFFAMVFYACADRWLRKAHAPAAAFGMLFFAGITLCLMENWVFYLFNGVTFLLLALVVDLAAGAWDARRSGKPAVAAPAIATRDERDDAVLRAIQIAIAVIGFWMIVVSIIRFGFEFPWNPMEHSLLFYVAAGVAFGATYLFILLLFKAHRTPMGRDKRATRFARRLGNQWVAMAAGLMCAMAIYVILFSTWFLFQWGFFEIYGNTLKYWAGQHAEHRLKGPFHFYIPRIVVYESAALAVAATGAIASIVRRKRLAFAVFAGIAVLWAVLWVTPKIGPLYFDRLWSDKVLHMDERWHMPFAVAIGWIATCLSVDLLLRRRPFHAFLVWATVFSHLEYSYAGEKVPWLALHIAGPLALLAGAEINRLLRWAGSARPAPLGRISFAALGLSGFALMLVWQFSVSWQVNIRESENPGQMLVYNHTTKETQDVAREIVALARQSGKDKQLGITITSDADATWPLIWDLREFEEFMRPEDLKTTQDPVVIMNIDQLAKSGRDFHEYRIQVKSLRMAWVPEKLDLFAAPRLFPLMAIRGVSEGIGNGNGSNTGRDLEETKQIAKSVEDWRKAIHYFLTREPWLVPGQTVVSIPVTYYYLRRYDSYPEGSEEAEEPAQEILPPPPDLTDPSGVNSGTDPGSQTDPVFALPISAAPAGAALDSAGATTSAETSFQAPAEAWVTLSPGTNETASPPASPAISR